MTNQFKVCGFRDSGEETSFKTAGLKREEDPALLHIPPLYSTFEKVVSVLNDSGVSEVRAKQLAATVIGAKLDDEYMRNLAQWIKEQAASRTIYNPAGLLVQMVHQLAPLPLPKGVGVPTLNGLQLELEQKKKFIEVQLPQIIAIEERNLLEAKCERDKQRVQARLDMLLAQQAKANEGKNLANGTAYLADLLIGISPGYITEQSYIRQHSDSKGIGGFENAPTY